MNKFCLVVSLLLLSISQSYATNIRQPADFIPSGYIEFDRYFGDLNNDGLDDTVLIIKKTDSRNFVKHMGRNLDLNERGLIILFKDTQGSGYTLADTNYSSITPVDKDPDSGGFFGPQLEMGIARNNLVIRYDYARNGYEQYVFRYQDSDFKLIGYDHSENRGPFVERYTSINFLTQRKLVRQNVNLVFQEDKDIFEETWTDIDVDELIALSEIDSFIGLAICGY